MITVLADVEHDATTFGGIAFRKVHSVGDADIAEIFVVVHDRKASVVIPLDISQRANNSRMKKELTEK